MNTYRFHITCPDCGGVLEHRRSMRVSDTLTQAETWCAGCLVVWQVDVGLTAVDTLAGLVVASGSEEKRRDRAGQALGDELSAFK